MSATDYERGHAFLVLLYDGLGEDVPVGRRALYRVLEFGTPPDEIPWDELEALDRLLRELG